MAQYFRPIIFKSDKTPIVYEYRMGGKLEPRTLTERSWWNSPVLSTVCERIVNNPQRIVWIGSCPNYDNNITPPNGLSLDEVNYANLPRLKSRASNIPQISVVVLTLTC